MLNDILRIESSMLINAIPDVTILDQIGEVISKTARLFGRGINDPMFTAVKETRELWIDANSYCAMHHCDIYTMRDIISRVCMPVDEWYLTTRNSNDTELTKEGE
ncbi:MAG: hypothetical protein K2O54_07255 [Prevotella sp.]|nr:hypothetical protein [Prevotella sp.]